MSAEIATNSSVDGRNAERLNITGEVEYRYAPGDTGVAQWQDVSQTGARLAFGRYLRPGRRVALLPAHRRVHDEPAEILGRIVWCRPVEGGKRFVAGIRFESSDAVGAFAISSLVREACKTQLYQSLIEATNQSAGFGRLQPAW